MAQSLPPGARLGAGAWRLLRNVLGLGRDALLAPLEARIDRSWVGVRLDRGLVEASTTPPWLAELRSRPMVLAHVLEGLERAAGDAAVRGVALRVGSTGLGWAQVTALGRAVEALRAAGKRVVVYAETTGNAGAWLGALADEFWVAPGGRVDLVGIRLEQPFLRGLLDRIGVRPEVLPAGRYKSAGELISHSQMSEPSREALDAVVDDLFEALVDGVAAGRGVEASEVRRWIDEGPYLAEEAKEAGIVDDVIYADEVPARLTALGLGEGAGAGEPEDARPIALSAYLRLARRRFRWRPVLEGVPELAVVPVVGVIRRGPATRAVVAALQRLEKVDSVKGVVLRVDSPGGDPLASEQIWRAICKLRETKPVVASLADRAASGGYYLAMGCDEVVAESTTLTGSIGVVLASVEFSELLERLGVRFDGVERGRHSGIFDPSRRRSEEERALLRRHVHRLYEDFVRKAADGRGLSIEEVERAAQGRVWTGRRAREQRLVDHMGGADAALRRIRALCGLGEDEGEVVRVSPLVSPLARLVRPDPIQVGDGVSRGAWLWCPIRIPLR